MQKILSCFHHIHHSKSRHEVHHCGRGAGKLNYKITHCHCGKHKINKKQAVGHDFSKKEVLIEFFESCEDGGWHVESGRVKKKL